MVESYPDLAPLQDELQAAAESAEALFQQALAAEQDLGSDRVIVELRQGVGGTEAALWVATLLRMYLRYGGQLGLQSEELLLTSGKEGGVKEAVIAFSGTGAEAAFRFEGGVHRVQRVSPTDKRKRMHTSAATVAVLDDLPEEELVIADADLRWESFHSSGNGGQHAQKSATAVRLTHLPTGMTVAIQAERSLLQNQERALRVLRARLAERKAKEQAAEATAIRRLQVGAGSRAEKSRTYNFPDNRVTDHRIGESFHNLDKIIDGNMAELQERLALA